jgi:hypothetical protein
MSIFDPKQTDSGTEPDADQEREDAPLPTRFGRHGRRNQSPRRAAEDPPAPTDDADPFEDDGRL